MKARHTTQNRNRARSVVALVLNATIGKDCYEVQAIETVLKQQASCAGVSKNT